MAGRVNGRPTAGQLLAVLDRAGDDDRALGPGRVRDPGDDAQVHAVQVASPGQLTPCDAGQARNLRHVRDHLGAAGFDQLCQPARVVIVVVGDRDAPDQTGRATQGSQALQQGAGVPRIAAVEDDRLPLASFSRARMPDIGVDAVRDARDAMQTRYDFHR